MFYRNTCNALNLADFLMIIGSFSLAIYDYLLSGSCFGVTQPELTHAGLQVETGADLRELYPATFCLLWLSDCICEDGLFLSVCQGFFAQAFLKWVEYLLYFQYGNELGNL